MSRAARKIALVSVVDPALMADQIASALGGRIAALRHLEAAIAALRGTTP